MKSPSSKTRSKAKGRQEQADEIAEILKKRREAKGKTIAELAATLSMPANQLIALESGHLEVFPSQLATLSSLRQYAKAIKLDGDQLALKLLDSWSIADSPDYLEKTGRTQSDTAEEKVYSESTSEIPVIETSVRLDKKRREPLKLEAPKSKTPRILVAMLWIFIVLIVAGLILIFLEHTHPAWFSSLKRQAVLPGTISLNQPTVTQANSSALKLLKSSSTGATYQVPFKNFDVKVTATQNCYVQITVPSPSSPVLFSGDMQNQSVAYYNKNNVSVLLGASGSSVSIFTSNKTIAVLTPKSVPFTYSFTS
jgi:cytoskeletal protein RodZ